MQLQLTELGEFREALKKVYSVTDFAQLLKDRLNRNIDDFTPPSKRDTAFAAVLEAANDEEWVAELARAVRAARPRNVDLRRVLEKFGFLAETPPGRELQKIIDESNALLDIGNWVAKVTEIEGRVCRIVNGEGAGAKPLGSGFLVGPSTVLTNHHVVDLYMNGERDPARLRAQFDYRVLRDGSTSAGTFVPLRDGEKWLLTASPPSPLDAEVHPLEQEVDAGHLDYAFLRLKRPIGAEPIPPAVPGADVPPRGCIDLTASAEKAATNAAIFIVQHPEGLPMKLALETKSALGYSPNERRMRYRTNTKPGSSGSPVFDQNWDLLALHHTGDPNWVDLPQYNEGIPVRTIVQHLGNDLLAQLGD
jgi:hypothetical protein